MTPEHLRTAGVGISAVSAAAAAAFWLATYTGATGYASLSSGVTLALGTLSVVAVLAAFHGWLAIYVLFLVRFVPIGFYLLGVPSLIALIGVLDLAYLTGGVIVHVAGTSAGRTSAPTSG